MKVKDAFDFAPADRRALQGRRPWQTAVIITSEIEPDLDEVKISWDLYITEYHREIRAVVRKIIRQKGQVAIKRKYDPRLNLYRLTLTRPI